MPNQNQKMVTPVSLRATSSTLMAKWKKVSKRSTTMAISDAWRDGSRRRIPPCELWLDLPVPAPAPPSASSYERTPGDLVAEMCATLSYLVPEGSLRASVVAELEALEPDLDVTAFAARLERVLARGGADSRSRPIVPDVIEARPDELAELRAQLDRLRRAAARCYASELREHHRVIAATLEPHRETTTVQAVDGPLAYTHVSLQDTLEASPEVADALRDIYLGPDTVSPTARASVLAGLQAF